MKLRLLRGGPNAQGHPCPGGSAAAQRKAGEIVARLHSMRLGKATELVETAIPETLANYAFPEGGGAFPNGNSALNLAADRLRHIAGTHWSTKRYLNMQLLKQRNVMIGLPTKSDGVDAPSRRHRSVPRW